MYLQKKIKKLYNLYAESEDDILLDTINENKKKLVLIKQTIESEIVQRNLVSNKEQLKDSIETLEEKWSYMTQQERQNIVRFLVEKVMITDNDVEIKLNI